jgi:hypothetical protein
LARQLLSGDGVAFLRVIAIVCQVRGEVLVSGEVLMWKKIKPPLFWMFMGVLFLKVFELHLPNIFGPSPCGSAAVSMQKVG